MAMGQSLVPSEPLFFNGFGNPTKMSVRIGFDPSKIAWWFGTCFSHILGMSSSQRTPSFFKGVGLNHQLDPISMICLEAASLRLIIVLMREGYETLFSGAILKRISYVDIIPSP